MRKVEITWTEFHDYSAEIEVPDNLSDKETLDWIQSHTDEWGMGWQSPDDIETDWESLRVIDWMDDGEGEEVQP
jgi:hypothetical protein